MKSWKTFEETIRRDRNRSIKAEIVTDDDLDGGGGGDDDMYWISVKTTLLFWHKITDLFSLFCFAVY